MEGNFDDVDKIILLMFESLRENGFTQLNMITDDVLDMLMTAVRKVLREDAGIEL